MTGKLPLTAVVAALLIALLGMSAAAETGTAGKGLGRAALEYAERSELVALQAEVNILKTVNRLDLKPDQIEQILAVLRDLQETMEASRSKLINLLTEERDILLAPETDQERLREVEKLLQVTREEMSLTFREAMVELKKILTARQLQQLQTGFAASPKLEIRRELSPPFKGRVEIEKGSVPEAGALRRRMMLRMHGMGRVEPGMRSKAGPVFTGPDLGFGFLNKLIEVLEKKLDVLAD